MQQQVLLTMQRLLAHKRFDHTNVIGNRGDMRKQVADPQTTLASLSKLQGLPNQTRPALLCDSFET